MPINASNQRNFHKTLYGQILETIILLKRGNDQQEGQVTKYTLFGCRHGIFTKDGQPIQGDIAVGSKVTWHIPVVEMDRNGIHYFNVLDRIIDKKGRYWEPESPQVITTKLLETHWCLDCCRVDPPQFVA